MKRATKAPRGQRTHLPLNQLRLDPRNPRLPNPRPSVGQQELIRLIDKAYDPLAIARSISEHTYFESEPLIVVEEVPLPSLRVIGGLSLSRD